MSSHDPGSIYEEWRKAEEGIEALEKELTAEQVVKIDLAEYQPGQPHYERLHEQIAEQQRHSWPSSLKLNV
jgi:hypothetical protein